MKASNLQQKVPFREILKGLKMLFRITWETDRVSIFLYYLLAFVGGFVPMLASWFLKLLIDQLQVGQGQELLTVPVIIVFVLAGRYLVNLITDLGYNTYQLNYVDFIIRYKLQNTLSLRFARKLSQLDMAHFEDPETQNMMIRVRQSLKWRAPNVIRISSHVVKDVIAYAAAFGTLMAFGLWIPLAVTLVAVPRLYIRAKYGKLNWSLWGAGAPQMRKLYYYDNLFADRIAIREMKIAQSAPSFLQKFDQLQVYLLNLNKIALNRYVRLSILPPLLENGFMLFVAYLFLGDVLSATISIGSFTFLISMLEQVNGTSSRLSSFLGHAYEDSLHLVDFVTLMEMGPFVPPPEKGVAIDHRQSPRIEFRDVSFAYPGGKRVLHHISFVIEPGESIALVGQNGAGKSTIINLLCRFYDADEGQILINDIDIRQIDLVSWYKALGTLFQNYVQYHFTIRENIAFENASAARLEDLQEAAQKSGAQDFIQKLPAAYEQQLGKEFEKGEELSGGQWQKLAIARAFYNQPPVLILDEPTSAIDAEAEYQIFNNLEQTYQDKSLILVSHRFSTVRNADKIYVIEEGKIIEQGSHKVLLNQKGKYAEMFHLQAEGYL